MAPDTSSGAADRSGSGETGRPDDSWRRVETEQPDRDRAARAHDTGHDPSPEFEYAIRPLDNDYGRDRPRDRELTPEQRAELAEAFDRPADELLALRENDPRAGHNRDEQGRILDQDGNPRPERTPEQMLAEAERQARLYGPETAMETTEPAHRERAEATDVRAPSEQAENATATGGTTATGEATDDQSQREAEPEDSPGLPAPTDAPGENSATDEDEEASHGSGGGGDSQDGSGRGAGSGDGFSDDGDASDGDKGEDGRDEGEPDGSDEPDSNQADDLGTVVGQIDIDRHNGKLTVSEVTNRLEEFRDSSPPAASEPTTDTVRIEQTPDGERRFQRETPVETADTTGERITTEQSERVSRAQRNSNEYKRAAEAVPDFEKVAEKVNALIDHRLPPGAQGETTVRQPDMPAIEARHTGEVDGGSLIAVGLAVTIASVVYAQRLRDKITSTNNQQKE